MLKRSSKIRPTTIGIPSIVMTIRSIPIHRILCYTFITTLYYSFIVVLGDRNSINDVDTELLRLQAKPWYTKNISIGNSVQLPISPMTIIITFLTLFYIMYYYYSSQCYCIASHILITDTSKETKQKLEQWRDKISTNVKLFEKYAHDYSECPSKQQHGNLGKFYMYDMAPNFNTICFDPKSKINTTLGPIQTQFGYHLIYIHQRQIPKQ